MINKTYQKNVVYINPTKIFIPKAKDRKVYKNLNQAKNNIYNMKPSPKELSRELLKSKNIKPIKLKLINKKYYLLEGRLKFWAWVIAFGYNQDIPSILE